MVRSLSQARNNRKQMATLRNHMRSYNFQEETTMAMEQETFRRTMQEQTEQLWLDRTSSRRSSAKNQTFERNRNEILLLLSFSFFVK